MFWDNSNSVWSSSNNVTTIAKIADDAVTTLKIGTAGATDANKILSTDVSGDPQWEDRTNFASSTLTDGDIFVGNSSDVATGVTPSGDVTISNTGVTTIGANKVTTAKIADDAVTTA